MKYSLSEFNQLGAAGARELLFSCCGSTSWVDQLLATLPFRDERQLFDAARQIWYEQCGTADYLEAFTHHPMIGDLESLKERFAGPEKWAAGEQSSVEMATEETLQALARGNSQYLEQNGFIYLVCATGKSAAEMLRLLLERLGHDRDTELRLAANEQCKITLLRLQKALVLEQSFWWESSHVTTHVLDTSQGKPGSGMAIRLKERFGAGMRTIGVGVTDADGRIGNLLPPGVRLVPGHYQMCFSTGGYFADADRKGFYPKVDIDFTIFDETHYHVPLLINPFGYTTYRGS